MKANKEVKISFWAAHFTTIISVTLLLILVGLIAMISLSARRETDRLRERMEVSVIMNDTVSDAYARVIADRIAARPYSLDTGVIGKEQALKDWKEETGDDLEGLFGVNPLSPEVYFRLKSDYSSTDSIKAISESLYLLPGVEEVAAPDPEMLDVINDNITGLSLILGIVALIMVIISFVLINNTVHLSIYSRRFTIHTMQLVGATDAFIRRPFITNNIIAGLVAGILASAIMAVSLAGAPHFGLNDVASYISWALYACVSGGMLLAGMAVCGVAAAAATSRYLHKGYDELFR